MQKQTLVERPPVVAVMGHIDHGKSTLLDYIRKTNIVAGEAGGITQHVSAYEVVHNNDAGVAKKITFLDTPGHAAFSGMRERGVEIADIAILVVSAEDGVKAQTLEALKQIELRNIPFIVAINKIDKPNASIEKAKSSLVEHGVYVEGYGGSISAVPVSAKTGEGIDELLSLILLTAELSELTGDTKAQAEGFVLESFLDVKRGNAATLIVKNGTLSRGNFILAGSALAPFRIVEDFLGKPITEATFSSPIKVTGWDSVPVAGTRFTSFTDKKEAEEMQRHAKEYAAENKVSTIEFIGSESAQKIIPLIIKTDVLGTLEAVKKEVRKIKADLIAIKLISEGVGAISENDVLLASSDPNSLIIGFNTKLESKAREQMERTKVHVEQFDIIYKLTEWLEQFIEDARPREEIEEVTGTIKILKIFSQAKDKQVIGGKVESGTVTLQSMVRILRKGVEIGRGKITELQAQKIKTDRVQEGTECGLMVESKMEIATGDVLESFIKVTK